MSGVGSARAKRALDLIVSTVGLVVASPVLGAAALAVRGSSPGPIFFRQERIGLAGKPFRIHKFRTMSHGAAGLAVSTAHDHRITRVGAVLRRTKLDELPQLIDVLRGDMSLVGPRPEVAKYVAQWPKESRDEILSVRPGITDPASIEMRNESDLLSEQEDPEGFYIRELLPLKASMYLDYVRTRSLVGDLKILALTIKVVARN